MTKDGTAEFQAVDARAAAIFDLIYPVGAVFATTGSAPERGTWEEIAQGRTLQGADDGHAAGTTIEPGLPNITGTYSAIMGSSHKTGPIDSALGVFKQSIGNDRYTSDAHNSGWWNTAELYFYASDSNPIYGNSTTVQPPAYVVHFYRRIA